MRRASGFDGVEILHRQMDGESPEYVNRLKQAAFRRGLAMPMLSIHQDFVSPDPKERQAAIDHTRALHRARGAARHSGGAPQFRAAGRRSSRSTT